MTMVAILWTGTTRLCVKWNDAKAADTLERLTITTIEVNALFISNPLSNGKIE